ncbi:MAG: anaerobic ribonucleoside-triphosphate reductase activating protein [Desulfobacteraceae bacterium]|jgi:pyruvate formate lyase activating enzyme
MLLGGLQKYSLIDFPGKVSCVLFLSGCNFDCPYCHNPDLVKGNLLCSSPLEESGVYQFLERRKGLLDGIVISGGEPTLAEDLAPLCEKIKGMGYPVKLDTNGSRPQVLKHLIDEGLVDYIAMDIKTAPSQYATFVKKDYDSTHIPASIQIIMESSLPHEFRTTCVKPFVDRGIIECVAKSIRGANRYVLQRFNDTRILHPEFFKEVDPGYDMDELMFLQSIAEPWVKECIVR